MDKIDVVALMLAARHDPAVKEQPEFREAKAALDASESLQAELAAEVAYFEGHEDLLSGVRLPQEARERIVAALGSGDAMPAENNVIEFQWQPLAYAAALVALVAVIGVVVNLDQSSVTVVEAPAESFELLQKFAASQVAKGISDLDFERNSTNELLTWLREHDAPIGEDIDERLADVPTMGCKIYDFQGRQVSLICFQSEDHGMVHLFVTNTSGFNPDEVDKCCEEAKALSNRNTVSWHDEENAYILIAHDADQELAEFGFSG